LSDGVDAIEARKFDRNRSIPAEQKTITFE
jgi:hypothetical protein